MSFIMQILDKRKIYYFEKRLPYANDFCFGESVEHICKKYRSNNDDMHKIYTMQSFGIT